MITVTDFILARVAEEEATADLDESAGHVTPYDQARAARTLARCAAVRKIVERHGAKGGVEPWMDASWIADMDEQERAGWCGWCTYDDRTVRFPCPDMRALASIWSDHPDWREDWR